LSPTTSVEVRLSSFGGGVFTLAGRLLIVQSVDWRIQAGENMMTYRELLRWFADEATPRSPYSIHAIARIGLTKFDKQIGDWFEPTTISEALRLLVTQHSPDGLKMYVPKDGILYRKEVYQLCVVQPADGPSQHLAPPDDGEGDDGLESSTDSMRHSHGNPGVPAAESDAHAELMSSAESECESFDETFGNPFSPRHRMDNTGVCTTLDSALTTRTNTSDAPPERTWHPVIILVPVRLGIQCLNPIYIPTLKSFFSFPQCLGVIGGKPHSSFYFVGYQGSATPPSPSPSFIFAPMSRPQQLWIVWC
jgi:cysteine protease ATG4